MPHAHARRDVYLTVIYNAQYSFTRTFDNMGKNSIIAVHVGDRKAERRIVHHVPCTHHRHLIQEANDVT